MTILDLNAENPFFESIIFLCSHDLPFPVMYGMYINITCKYTTYRCISVYIQCTRMCLIVNLCKKKKTILSLVVVKIYTCIVISLHYTASFTQLEMEH